MSLMGFVKQEMPNFKDAIKGTETRGKLSLKILSISLLGTAECGEDSFKCNPAQIIIYALTAASVIDSV